MLRLSGRDLILLLLLTLFWGLNWPIMKIGVRELEPMTFRGLSMVGGLMVLAVIIRVQGLSLRVPREDWRELFTLALTNMIVWFVLAMYGLKLLSSGKAAILGYTLPIWAAIWSVLLFGERLRPRMIVGVVAAAIGVLLLVAGELSHMAGRPVGTLCMLTAAAVWGYGTHLMRRRRTRIAVSVLTFWCLAQSVVVCGVVAVVFERGSWQRWPNGPEWASILYNAVLIFGLAQIIWFRLATLLPPVASGLSVMLIPVIGLFSGMWMLGERPAWQDYLALASILAAMATVLLPASGQPRAAAPAGDETLPVAREAKPR